MKKVGANDGCVVGPISDLRVAKKEDRKIKKMIKKILLKKKRSLNEVLHCT